MTESPNFTHLFVPKFDDNYEQWSMLMENLLRSKEYWSLIETGVITIPFDGTPKQLKSTEESKLCDFKAKNYLFQSIDCTILKTILVRDTTEDIWEAMRRKYQGFTKVKHAHV